MMVNSLGRELPEKVGSYIVRPYGSEAVETAVTVRTNPYRRDPVQRR